MGALDTMKNAGVHLENLIGVARENVYFRHVLMTGDHTQVVVMTIPPGGEIGEELHEGTDQLLILVEGSGRAILDGEPLDMGPGDAVLVPAGTRHNVEAAAGGAMKIITTYAPPHHPDGTIHVTREDATETLAPVR